MAKNPADRFAAMSAVAAELGAILRNPASNPVSKAQQSDPLPPKPANSAADAAARASQSGTSPRQSGAAIKRSQASLRQSVASLNKQTLTEYDLASIEELARKCLARRDYDQITQMIERIPEDRRNARLRKRS